MRGSVPMNRICEETEEEHVSPLKAGQNLALTVGE
jgi:hypothetical protein